MKKFLFVLIFAGISSNVCAVEYQVFDLGVSGNTFSIARAINNSNQVVGQTQEVPGGRSNAVLWDSGVMTEIGSSFTGNNYATGINDSGKITINYINEVGTTQAVVWDNGSVVELGLARDTVANDINESGQVVGLTKRYNISRHRAFLWENGTSINLTPEFDGTGSAYTTKAEGINDLGQIVGFITSQAFMWDSGNKTGLGTLGGSSSIATDINNLGQIAGFSDNLAGNQEAFIWENDVMEGLGTLGGTLSNAWAINEQSQVVGRSLNSDGEEAAFLWKDGSMFDLCVLTDCLLEGWDSLIQASDINDHGNIVGHGIKDGEIHAFYIQAVPVPAAIWLFGSSLLGFIGVARRKGNA